MKGAVIVPAILLLHGPTGREIRLNTKSITSLHSPEAPGANKRVADGANCLINTSDGKFINVIETCAAVARMIEEQK